MTKKDSGAHALVADDVLHVSAYGVLDGDTLLAAMKRADACGAVLFDVTGAITNRATMKELEIAWRERVSPRPTALVHRHDDRAYWHELMMRLASPPVYPTPLAAYPAVERIDAILWCRERAITLRDAQARRKP
jgi:hypothetical protein